MARAIPDQAEDIRCLREQLNQSRHLPSGPVYISMSRMLARLLLDAGNMEEAIFHLVESHAIALRHRAELRYCKIERQSTTNGNTANETLDKKFVGFRSEYSNNYQGVLSRVREMPPEWTVVQISCTHDPVARFSSAADRLSRTPALHLVRIACGPKAPEPVCVTVPAPVSDYLPMNELTQLLELNQTDKLIGNRHLYWGTRAKVDAGMQALVQFLDKSWLVAWGCLLRGRLTDPSLEKLSISTVERLVQEEAGTMADLGPRCRYLLQCAVESLPLLERSELLTLVAVAVGESRKSARCMRLVEGLEAVRVEVEHLGTARRHPVILVVDEKLDELPWEMTAFLRDHPSTRVLSLHILHALYKAHESTIKNGYKLVSPKDGYYLVNPGCNLPDMEDRMRRFVEERLPNWEGLVGKPPQSAHFDRALTRSSIFVYMGHGAGSQYFSSSSVEHMQVSACVLLFGCSSARLSSLGDLTEKFGRVLSFHLATSPCVVGMLWPVTDKDTDLVAQKLLDAWLPKDEKVVEPDLLRAMNLGRGEAKQFINSAAMVAWGLPVKIQSVNSVLTKS